MVHKGSHKGQGKATDRARIPTLVINRCLSLVWDSIKGFISEHIRRLIRIYIVWGVNDVRAWDLLYDMIFIDPVTTRHLSQFQLMWPHHTSRISRFWEWWAAFHWYMGQIVDKSRNQMNSWRWDNPWAFRDQVARFNLQTTSLGHVRFTSEHFAWYGRNNLRGKIEPPSCPQYKPGNFLAVRPLNSDEIFDQDDDDGSWADPGVLSCGRSRPNDGNHNDDGNCGEDRQGGEIGTGKEKETKGWEGQRETEEEGESNGGSEEEGEGKQ